MIEQLQALQKALEAGSLNSAPGSRVQGSALQMENLETVLQNVCFEESAIKLQKKLEVKDCKSTIVAFSRQLSYGNFGGSAQYEGMLGEENTADFVQAVVPMCYYSTTYRSTIAANLVDTFTGVKAEDQTAKDAAMKIAGDIEFDSWRGQEDFSNAGVFDGNPLAIAKLPNMVGVTTQIRQSDAMSNTHDLMFEEFGSNQSIVLPINGTLNQSNIEDAAVRSAMNNGQSTDLALDPISLSAYNKLAHNKERIVLAGSAAESTGSSLRTQWTSNGEVKIEPCRFLAGKTRPQRSRAGAPAAPTFSSAHAGTDGIIPAGSYVYFVTAVSERGESAPSAAATVAVGASEHVALTISAVSGAKYYNIYRSNAGGSAASAALIGKIAQGAGNPVFYDLGNKTPGSVTGVLYDAKTMAFYQLSAFQTIKLAVSDLSTPSAAFKFCSVAVRQPRKNVLLDNIKGSIL